MARRTQESRVTTPVATRVLNRHADTLRLAAERDGVTVSALLARIVAEAAPHLL